MKLRLCLLWPVLVAGCGQPVDLSNYGVPDPGGGGDVLYVPPTSDAAEMPIPPDFTPATWGGYKLGAALPGGAMPDAGLATYGENCGVLVGVVRDFKGKYEPGGHPDFEAYGGQKATKGLVAAELGSDGKPVYASVCEANPPRSSCPYGQETTSKAYFDQWYRYADGMNLPYLVYFSFLPNGSIDTFNGQLFFPLDGAGWGYSGVGEDGRRHNFHFTTELHIKFQYNGGEKFSFSGDDDLWVFINGKLAIDLGGLHPAVDDAVDLDARAASLGLSPGNVYPLELFHAERHTTASHFRVDTTLTVVDCGYLVPDVK
jgi:fibro-slime domain-containing protein